MTAPAKVFIARLADLPVFDPIGDQVGRVRDVVVLVRTGREAPRVLGLAVEVTTRRRIFVPISRVTAFESDAVILGTGMVNLRRFEQRPGETLVLGELLDRAATVVETGERVTVVDVAMTPTRTRDWQLTRAAVRAPAKRLGRRGQLREFAWDEVSGLSLAEAEQGAANLLAAFDRLKAPDLAGILHDLPAKRRQEVVAALNDERLADVLEELPEEDRVQILGALESERAARVLEAMDPDDAADLLGELSTEEAERLLRQMEPDEAEPVRRLLSYSDDTAGGLMTTDPVVLPPTATVAEALARVRHPELTPALASQVYVCRPPTETPTGKYLGIAHIQRLLREPPSVLVGGVVDTDIDPLSAECPLPALTSHLATYNLVAVPIVDSDDHLIGAVTVDDVLDHLLPENWREHSADGDGGPAPVAGSSAARDTPTPRESGVGDGPR